MFGPAHAQDRVQEGSQFGRWRPRIDKSWQGQPSGAFMLVCETFEFGFDCQRRIRKSNLVDSRYDYSQCKTVIAFCAHRL
jgi:hypothetical protein